MSLVELVIAMMLVAMALVALAGAAATAQRSLATADAIERITRETAGLMDSLTAHAAPAAGQRTEAGVSMTWTVSPDSLGARVVVVAEAYDGARPVRLTFEARHASR
jgi:Tfp pilus assembly protein PilV